MPASRRPADWLRRQPEGRILHLVFCGLAGLAVAVLLLDLRTLWAAARPTDFGLPAMEPVPMERPRPDDQIRPYLPHTRPLDPGDPRHGRPQGEGESEPMRFSLGTYGSAFARGTIVPGTADALAEFLDAHPDSIVEIVLHSPGGSVSDAMTMAGEIRGRGLATRVLADGYCASSCPLVFAAGTERVAADTAWIGVHQVFALTNHYGTLAEGMEEGQRVSAEAQLQLVGFGVDPRVWIHAMQTPKDQLYLFTPAELTELKLATSVETADGSPS